VVGLKASVARFDGAAPLRLVGNFGILKTNYVSATRYSVRVLSPDTTTYIMLAGMEFPLDGIDVTLRGEGTRLSASGVGRLFSGRVDAVLEFPEVATGAHRGTVSLTRVGFGRLSAIMNASTETGGSISAQFAYDMPSLEPTAITGNGTATLEDANIFSLPLLGPLSSVINTLLPGDKIAYSVARRATTTFNVRNGKVETPDFEASTGTFKLLVNGVADLIAERVDFNARINLRGVPGLILYPVSKILEYEATGTLKAPDWHARLLPRPFRNNKEPAKEKAKSPS
jgi:hypothetical protein